jgi:hypothetical protein
VEEDGGQEEVGGGRGRSKTYVSVEEQVRWTQWRAASVCTTSTYEEAEAGDGVEVEAVTLRREVFTVPFGVFATEKERVEMEVEEGEE